MSNPYSPLKVFHHQDRLQTLRAGNQIVPTQVQLIISDLCNQDCGFCVAAGSVILTPNGGIPIEDIRKGDVVTAPDGGTNVVTETSERETDSFYEIEIGGRILRVTGEHPILTTQGFVEAKNLREGDAAVVRMRMREEGQREPSISGPVELVRSLPPTQRRPIGEVSQTILRTYEEEQSHVQQGGSQAGFREDERQTSFQEPGRVEEYSRGGKETDAVCLQSDEESGYLSESQPKAAVQNPAVKDRGPIHCLVEGVGFANRVHGQRSNLYRKTQSRFSSDETEEGFGAYPEGDVQRATSEASGGYRLRVGDGQPLSKERLELSSSVCQGSERPSLSPTIKDTPRLHIGGIELERGLGLQPITKITRVEKTIKVYNFSCDRIQAYEVNGVVVHNCAYRTSGYSSNQLFAKDAKLAAFGHSNPVRMIPYAKVIEILDDCRDMGIRAVQLTGGGEPSVHPRFEDILEAILDRGLDLALVTNGVNLSSNAIRLLTRARWVRFSIDAGTAETYCSVRRVSPAHWNRVWQNLRTLCQREKGDLAVGVGFVVTRDNYHEILHCVTQAKAAGADNVRISAVFQDEGSDYFAPFYDQCRRLIAEAKQLENCSFRVFDNFGDRVEDLEQGSPDYSFCGYQQFTTYIGGDLNVYRCCVLAYNERGIIGSIKNQRFKTLWESEQKRRDFDGFNARGCPRCMFNGKNRTILYALDPSPAHVNFV